MGALGARARLLRNAAASGLQVVVAGAVLFLLYRFLVQTVGVERLGTWSLVAALAAIARIGELGLPGSVVKFVAKAEAAGPGGESARVVRISLLAVAAALGLAVLVAHPLLAALLGRLLAGEALGDALAILPLSLLVVWVNGTAGVLLGALDGHQRGDLRSLGNVIGALVLIAAALALVPRQGLPGLVLAQLAQAAALCALPAWVLWRRPAVPAPGGAPAGGPATRLRDLLGYGGAFQLISLVGLLLDPMTKAILATVGSPGAVAYFEMAGKMVAQFRALIVSANQVVVPLIASLQETQPKRIADIYRNSCQLLLFLVIPLFAAVGAMAPLVSELWLGHYRQEFVVYSLLLLGANLINVLSGPAYFSNLGEGELRWNVIAHVLMAMLNGLLGVVLGAAFGVQGAVAGNALAVAVASLVVMAAFQARRSIRMTELLHRNDAALLAAGSAAVLVGVLRPDFGDATLPLAARSLFCLLAIGGLLFLPVWRHPVRRRLGGLLAGAWRPS